MERSAETLEDVRWFEVKELRGRIDRGRITEFQVKTTIAFRLHAADEEDRHGDLEQFGEPRTRPTRATRSALAQRATLKGEHKRPELSHPEEATARRSGGKTRKATGKKATAKKEPAAARRGATGKKKSGKKT